MGGLSFCVSDRVGCCLFDPNSGSESCQSQVSAKPSMVPVIGQYCLKLSPHSCNIHHLNICSVKYNAWLLFEPWSTHTIIICFNANLNGTGSTNLVCFFLPAIYFTHRAISSIFCSVKQFLALVRKLDVNMDTISTKVNSALTRLEKKYDVTLALYQRFEKWVNASAQYRSFMHAKQFGAEF